MPNHGFGWHIVVLTCPTYGDRQDHNEVLLHHLGLLSITSLNQGIKNHAHQYNYSLIIGRCHRQSLPRHLDLSKIAEVVKGWLETTPFYST